MGFTLTPKRRLIITIGISFTFFVAEIAIAFLTKSLALVADAFHYASLSWKTRQDSETNLQQMNDLVGFIVALTALIISERAESPQELSFGWQRAQLLGAFFNGVFLLALGISIFLQSIERFISIQHVENPKLVLIMGCIGLGLNIISASFLHEHHGHDHGGGHGHSHGDSHSMHSDGIAQEDHDMVVSDLRAAPTTPGPGPSMLTFVQPIQPHAEHRHNAAKLKSPGRDLGMLGVLTHVIGDALNNVGVIIAALVIWQADYAARFYADPGASMGIAVMILLTALPLVKNSGAILLQSAPRGVDLGDVKHDLEKIPGIESVHELHVWRLDQKKAIASVHVVVSDQSVSNFMEKARTVSECLHAYGIHSATLQPETAAGAAAAMASASASPSAADAAAAAAAPATESVHSVVAAADSTSSSLRRRGLNPAACQMVCGNLCENLMCCTSSVRI